MPTRAKWVADCIGFQVIAVMLSSAGAIAQMPPASSLQALTNTPQYQQNIAHLFDELPPDVFQRCPTLVSKGSSVTVEQPPTFAPDGYPISGAWRQSFPVQGCGNDTTINFFFTASADEKIHSIVGAPGDTHASAVLQKDAARYVMMEVQLTARGCASFHIHATRYDGRLSQRTASAVPISQPWQETWTMSACGVLYRVPVTFVPDATGTAIHAAPAQPTAN